MQDGQAKHGEIEETQAARTGEMRVERRGGLREGDNSQSTGMNIGVNQRGGIGGLGRRKQVKGFLHNVCRFLCGERAHI